MESQSQTLNMVTSQRAIELFAALQELCRAVVRKLIKWCLPPTSNVTTHCPVWALVLGPGRDFPALYLYCEATQGPVDPTIGPQPASQSLSHVGRAASCYTWSPVASAARMASSQVLCRMCQRPVIGPKYKKRYRVCKQCSDASEVLLEGQTLPHRWCQQVSGLRGSYLAAAKPHVNRQQGAGDQRGAGRGGHAQYITRL